jgi:nitrite reductase/ring-hydroxylating ferredoxin subunit
VTEARAALRIPAGSASDLGRDTVRVVALPKERGRIPREALVLRDRAGVVRAYLNRCQHLPIPLDGGSRRFWSADGEHLLCGTHGAHYRREDGLCVLGPCYGASLIALELERDGDELHIRLDE